MGSKLTPDSVITELYGTYLIGVQEVGKLVGVGKKKNRHLVSEMFKGEYKQKRVLFFYHLCMVSS